MCDETYTKFMIHANFDKLFTFCDVIVKNCMKNDGNLWSYS